MMNIYLIVLVLTCSVFQLGRCMLVKRSPNDIDSDDSVAIAMILGNTAFCTDDPYNLDGSDDNMLGTGNDNISFKFVVYNMCSSMFCKDRHGDGLYECVRERCCGHSNEKNMRKRSDLSKLVAPSGSLMTRQRRFSNEVNQCIMSYCNGSNGLEERIRCITTRCNRRG